MKEIEIKVDNNSILVPEGTTLTLKGLAKYKGLDISLSHEEVVHAGKGKYHTVFNADSSIVVTEPLTFYTNPKVLSNG